MSKKLTTEEFIERAKKVHGDRYDYSETDYIDTRSTVSVICIKHGKFTVRANSHLQGQGCRTCSTDSTRLTTEEFIARSIEIHGNKYDYSDTIYSIARNKVTIICAIHGKFEQFPHKHLEGAGCKKCGLSLGEDEFLKRAKQIHGDRYDYTLVHYIFGRDKIKIICSIHGIFLQTAAAHSTGQGCPKCGRLVAHEKCRSSKDEFIEKATKIHDARYDYSLVEYIDNKKNVKIKCSIHGIFLQTPNSHLRGTGCPKCGISKANSKKPRRFRDKEEFIRKAREIHGDKYDYNLSDFKSTHSKIKIGCSTHGIFIQQLRDHLYGHGCQKCHFDMLAESKLSNKDEFVRKAQLVHGNKFDYSLVLYKGCKHKIEIICSIHGPFWQNVGDHLGGAGCNKCRALLTGNRFASNKDSFIKKAQKTHGTKYDYSLVEYIKSTDPVKIICPNHGIFLQTPSHHIAGSCCAKCNNIHNSRGAQRIENWLKENKINYLREHAFKTCRAKINTKYLLRFDFYVPDYKVLIEFDGEQHYNKKKRWYSQRLVDNDKTKKEWADSHGHKLMRITWTDEKNIESILAHNLLKKLNRKSTNNDYNRSIWG